MVRRWWERWKITVIFVLLACSFLFAYALNDRQNDKRVQSACDSVTQVKSAALELTDPVSTKGVTDADQLARIAAANEARTFARNILEQRLACRD